MVVFFFCMLCWFALCWKVVPLHVGKSLQFVSDILLCFSLWVVSSPPPFFFFLQEVHSFIYFAAYGVFCVLYYMNSQQYWKNYSDNIFLSFLCFVDHKRVINVNSLQITCFFWKKLASWMWKRCFTVLFYFLNISEISYWYFFCAVQLYVMVT